MALQLVALATVAWASCSLVLLLLTLHATLQS